ncbi:hypothetical protein [Oleispirillum naphthae]|uniref:hypothetical protein n=1 Tax=Oleispirillum naphthae TaxID=2838853 RepID=UPI0030823497
MNVTKSARPLFPARIGDSANPPFSGRIPPASAGSFRGFKRNAAAIALAVSAVLLVAACAPEYSAPQQVQASNPRVTYKYHGDQELVQVNQSAVSFCSQYQSAAHQSVPRTLNFSDDPDGSKLVVFECVQTLPQAALPVQYNPSLTYTYRTDQELADASRNAQIYCMNNGGQQVISSIGANANGSRTVAFQCSSTLVSPVMQPMSVIIR